MMKILRVNIMVLVLDGNSETGAHIRSTVCFLYLFKAFDWIESSHKADFFSPKRPTFIYVCATCSELPSNMRTMVNISFAIFGRTMVI